MGRDIFVHFGEVIPEYGWIGNLKKKRDKIHHIKCTMNWLLVYSQCSTVIITT